MRKRQELRPNKEVFLNYTFLKHLAISFIILLVAYFLLNLFFSLALFYFIGFFILLNLWSYYSLKVRYEKERYLFSEDRIIAKGGSIFSEYTAEVIVRNITHVKLILPFLENKIYGTGKIEIETAGKAKAEIILRSISKPKEIEQEIITIMEDNGFKLEQEKLVQEEKPHPIAVFLEVGGLLVSGFFIFLIFMSWIISLGTFLVFLFMIAIIGLLLIGGIFRFLDLKNRVYRLYDDTITYKEGFLTKNYSFIPIENLADAATDQTFIEKILGLYDVKISCQGAGTEILFKNMKNGRKLEANIDDLISKTPSLVRERRMEKGWEKEVKVEKEMPHIAREMDTAYTAQFSMDWKKSLLPTLLLGVVGILILIPISIFFPVALSALPLIFMVMIPLLGGQIIKIACTTYGINPNSVEQKYEFLSSRRVEFNNEKIVGMVFRESIFDKLFNTLSVKFWSIGSSANVNFSNIKKFPSLKDKFLGKIGIERGKSLYSMYPHYSIIEMLKSSLFTTFISVIMLGGSLWGGIYFNPYFYLGTIIIAGLYLLVYIYKKIYYQKLKLSFCEGYIHFKKGLLVREEYFVPYKDVKDIVSKKYPFSSLGNIRFNVAGEEVKKQGKKQYTAPKSCHFAINYVENIRKKRELMDLILYRGSKEAEKIEQNLHSYLPQVIRREKPQLANTLLLTMVGLVILDGIVWGIINFMRPSITSLMGAGLGFINIAILAFALGRIKVTSYVMDSLRVLKREGILYRKQTSVLYNRIDHLDSNQGMINKIFGNGNVGINTIGSRKTELTLKNLPHYKEIYDIIERNY